MDSENLSETTSSLVLIFYHVQDTMTLTEKHDQIMNWVDLPLEERPQLMMGWSIFFASRSHVLTLAQCMSNRSTRRAT